MKILSPKIESNSITTTFTLDNGELSYTYVFEQNLDANDPVLIKLADLLAAIGATAAIGKEDTRNFVLVETSLGEKELKFLEKLYKFGLGEYNYLNKLPLEKDYKFTIEHKRNLPIANEFNSPSRTEGKMLVLHGGGKDTLVATEIVRGIGFEFEWFNLKKRQSLLAHREALVEISGVKSLAIVERKTTEKNWDKSYSGHRPSSALLAIVAVIEAHVRGLSYVVAGNEFSANFPTLITAEGFPVNHQYSKSFEFEVDFQNILANLFPELGVQYFSILRKLYEVEIAEIFAHFPKYFGHFVSCNVSQVDSVWCKDCSKCAFVFLALYPYLNDSQVVEIWGEDLFNRESIREHIYDLVKHEGNPFECVGTTEESVFSLIKSIERNPWIADLVFKDRKGRELISGRKAELIPFESREAAYPSEIAEKITEYIYARITK